MGIVLCGCVAGHSIQQNDNRWDKRINNWIKRIYNRLGKRINNSLDRREVTIGGTKTNNRFNKRNKGLDRREITIGWITIGWKVKLTVGCRQSSDRSVSLLTIISVFNCKFDLIWVILQYWIWYEQILYCCMVCSICIYIVSLDFHCCTRQVCKKKLICVSIYPRLRFNFTLIACEEMICDLQLK